MFWQLPCPEDTTHSAVTYCFAKPCKVKIRKNDGTVENFFMGIGDKVRILEPEVRYLVPPTKMRSEIPLEDGSAIIEWSSNIEVFRESTPHLLIKGDK